MYVKKRRSENYQCLIPNDDSHLLFPSSIFDYPEKARTCKNSVFIPKSVICQQINQRGIIKMAIA
jgi:hypothetical protein